MVGSEVVRNGNIGEGFIADTRLASFVLIESGNKPEIVIINGSDDFFLDGDVAFEVRVAFGDVEFFTPSSNQVESLFTILAH